MPSNPHYEAVRKAVIAACPELMELSFGAKLHRHNERFGDYSVYYVLTYAGQGRPEGQVWISSIPFGSMTLDMSKDEIKNGGEFEIIGHTIQMSHIFRTINQAERFVSASSEGRFAKLDNQCGEICFWDLKQDDLASQSPETWEALDKMLSV
jgi:hypothetical protein